MRQIANEWQRFDKWDRHRFTGIKFELKYPDGTVKKIDNVPSVWTQQQFDSTSRYYQNHPSKFWDQETMETSRSQIGKFWDHVADTYVVAEETWIRLDPKKVEKFNTILSIIQEGDFARFPSSRIYKWRKILTIDWETLDAHGQCCSDPDNESLVFHSSSNSLSTVLEIVRDGKTIYPTKEK